MPPNPPFPEGPPDPPSADPSHSQEVLGRFFRYSRDLLGVLSLDGIILEVNPAAERILGYDPAALAGRSFWDLVHPEEMDLLTYKGREILAGGVAEDFECRFLAADGSWVPLRWSVSAESDAGLVFGVGRRVSGAQRLHQRIEEGEAFLRHLFRTLPEGIVSVRADGAISRANRAAVELLGLDPEDLGTHRVWDVLSAASLADVMQRVGTGGEGIVGPATLEAEAFRPNGSVFPVLVSVLQWPETPGMVVLVLRDLTGARREEERRMKEARRRQGMELQLATARELHDGILQTLSAIGVRLEIAARLVEKEPESGRQAIDSLADVVRAEQRELRLYVDELKVAEPVWRDREDPLQKRIQGMLDRIQTIWGVRSTLEGTGSQSTLPADVERRVVRIIQEAVVNAARHGKARQALVRVDVGETEVEVEIEDDGRGFPFEGDYDDEDLRSQNLGPISLKQRVREGKGRLAISSHPGSSRLSVRLPVDPPKEG